jgi:hypothetical protein
MTGTAAAADTRLPPAHDWFELRRSQIVRDPADAGATGALARRLGELDGVVAVALAPGETRPLGALGMAILDAMGKDLDLTPALGQQDAWRLARAWLEAERTEALVITGSELFTSELWEGIDDMRRFQRAGAVILISHQVGHAGPRRRPRPAERSFDRSDPATLHAWAARLLAALGSRDSPNNPPTLRYPVVPADEAPFFRAACRAILEPSDFARVNRSYRRGYDITRRWLAGRDEITEDEACVHLAENVLWTPDIHERLTRLRGAQIAFLRHSWLLKVDLEAFSAANASDRPSAIDASIAERLRMYAQPKPAAMAALTIATKLPAGALAMLNADQVLQKRARASYATIDFGDRRVAIEPAARPFLCAHHIDRVLRGEPADGPLFTTTAGRRMSTAALRQQLRRISQDTGLSLLSSSPLPNDDERGHWMRRRGITVQPL